MAWLLVMVAGIFRDRFRGASEAEPWDHSGGADGRLAR